MKASRPHHEKHMAVNLPVKEGTPRQNSTAAILNEITEKRQRSVKHFFRDDGTYAAYVYPSPAHYLVNGVYKDIDNSLIDTTDDTGNAVLQNKDNEYKVNISKNTQAQKLIRLVKDKYELSWNIKGIGSSLPSITPKNTQLLSSLPKNNIQTILGNIESAINLKSIFSGVDVTYQVKSTQFKENIIINKKLQNPQFVYNLYVKNLGAKLLSNRTIVFYDTADETNEIFIMRVPFMIDSNNNVSDDITVSFEVSKTGYTLTITPDNAWINSSGRVFPITIDPYVQTSTSASDISDTYISSNNTGSYTDPLLKVGYDSTSGQARSLIKFTLPTLTAAETIYYAGLSMYLSATDTTNSQIDVHKVTMDWNSSSVTWSAPPSFDSKIEEFQIMSSAGTYNFDVTGMAKSWYTEANFGLMLMRDPETIGTNNSVSFYSSDSSSTGLRPQVTVYYVNNSGLEGYWTYHSQDVGRAGTGHVNDYTGNLVFIHNDLSMNGNRMPATINHVYNSNDNSKDKDIGYGPGWRLNLSQTVKWEPINSVNYYTHTDEDGTKHYYKYDSSKGYYVDDAGTGFMLTAAGSGTSQIITITDKSGNKLDFGYYNYLMDIQYLTDIQDKNGNKITLGYDANNKLTTVTDGVGRITTLTYNTVGVGYLLEIAYPDGRKTEFRYAGALLNTITYPDNMVTTYTYDTNNLLTGAINYDGYKMTYSYYDKSVSGNILAYRIQSIQEANTDGTAGGGLTLSYGKNSTTFIDSNGRKNIYQFNYMGNTMSIQDTDGSAQYYQYIEQDVNKNKLTVESKLQKTVINLLKNHNMESSGGWTAGGANGSTGSGNFDTSIKNIGNQSLKVVKTNTSGRQYFLQAAALTAGGTYTLSGYVKTMDISNTNGMGAVVYATYATAGGDWPYEDSRYVNGTEDFQRIEVTFTLPSDMPPGYVYIGAGIAGETGTAYFDNLQLEEGPIANRYNLVENPSLEGGTDAPDSWTKNEFTDSSDTITNAEAIFGSQSFKFTGQFGKAKQLYQDIDISGNAGDEFIAGAWAKADSVPVASGYKRNFALDVVLRGATQDLDQVVIIPFNDGVFDWQYLSQRIIANNAYVGITVYLLYYYNANTAYFDGIQLYREEFGTSFTYDTNGNVETITDLAGQTSTFKYDGNNDLINATDPKGSSFEYAYDGSRNISSAVSSENVKYSFTYDSYGNPITAKVSDTTMFIGS